MEAKNENQKSAEDANTVRTNAKRPVREINGTRQAGDTGDAAPVRDAKSTAQTRNTKSTAQTRNVNGTAQTRDAKNAAQTRNVKSAAQARDVRSTAKDTRQTGNAKRTAKRTVEEAGKNLKQPERQVRRTNEKINSKVRSASGSPKKSGTDTVHKSEVKGTAKSGNKKVRRSGQKKNIAGMLGYLLFIAVLYGAVMYGLNFGADKLLSHGASGSSGNVVFQLGADKKVYKKRKCTLDEIKQGSVYYADMSDIAEYCGMTTTGGKETRRYIIRSSGESLLFEIGKSSVKVNGMDQRMEAACILKDNRLYVPISFIDRCFNGLETNIDVKEGKITVAKTYDDNGKEAEIELLYKPCAKAQPIVFGSLSRDLQRAIIQTAKEQGTEIIIEDDGE